MQKHNIYNTLGINSLYLFWWFTAVSILAPPFSAAGMPQLLILQPLLWVVPLITTSSKPRLSSAFRFKRRQGAAGAGNSPSVSEGVAEGRGSNMSVKIPCAWARCASWGGQVDIFRDKDAATTNY
jgi:hypothetical protein